MKPGSRTAHKLRRVHSLARRPSSLIAISHPELGTLVSMPVEELRIAAEAADMALRRERARSAMRHWSYDVNRHIAIKRARDRIAGEIAGRKRKPAPEKEKPRTRPRLFAESLRPD